MAEEHVTVKLSLSPLPNGRYRSRIEDSPAGASQGSGTDFVLPTPPKGGYPKFLKDAGTKKSAEANLQKFGRSIFDKVFAKTVGKAFERARAWAQSRKAFLRIAISALSPDLVQVPWEYLHDGNNYLLLQKIHIVRILDELPQQMAPFRPFGKLLMAVANPQGMPRFDADNHIETLKHLVEEMGAIVTLLFPATRLNLERSIEQVDFDAFYFLGHGQFDPRNGGQIFLEDRTGGSDPLYAAVLAKWFASRRQPVYFAYFNSCYTGTVKGDTTFAGVAQRILADGNVPGLVAQQAPMLAQQSMKVAESFLRRVGRGDSPEAAISYARTAAPNVTWGIPVVYTHLRGPEEFERNRIESLFEANSETRFVLSLATFRMGVLRKDYIDNKVKVVVEPSSSYHYRGDTHPLTAVMAAWDVMGLLSKVVPREQIQLVPADAETSGTATHQFFFGSRSHERVVGLLRSFHAKIQFKFGSEWVLTDTEFGQEYRVPDLSKLHPGEYDKLTDYGIIEKIVDAEAKRVFFVIAGLGDRATRGCARYLVDHWPKILEDHVRGEFRLILEFPGSLQYHDGRLVDRSAGKPFTNQESGDSNGT